nr:MAG TPA: hypothetical protein [Caudoviricetes sp.]
MYPRFNTLLLFYLQLPTVTRQRLYMIEYPSFKTSSLTT